jgi:hypothetical protein
VRRRDVGGLAASARRSCTSTLSSARSSTAASSWRRCRASRRCCRRASRQPTHPRARSRGLHRVREGADKRHHYGGHISDRSASEAGGDTRHTATAAWEARPTRAHRGRDALALPGHQWLKRRSGRPTPSEGSRRASFGEGASRGVREGTVRTDDGGGASTSSPPKGSSSARTASPTSASSKSCVMRPTTRRARSAARRRRTT